MKKQTSSTSQPTSNNLNNLDLTDLDLRNCRQLRSADLKLQFGSSEEIQNLKPKIKKSTLEEKLIISSQNNNKKIFSRYQTIL